VTKTACSNQIHCTECSGFSSQEYCQERENIRNKCTFAELRDQFSTHVRDAKKEKTIVTSISKDEVTNCNIHGKLLTSP
jgi:hypothetical protein